MMSVNEPGTSGRERGTGGGSASTDKVKDKAREMKDLAMERGEQKYEEGKRRAGGEIHAVARAFRTAANELRADDHASTGRWIEMAADRVEEMADGIERQDLSTLMRESRRMARRNAGAFLAGAVALGFVASRFLKAEPDHRDDFENDPFELDRADAYRTTAPGVDSAFITRAEE
jgi:hypothetical protein